MFRHAYLIKITSVTFYLPLIICFNNIFFLRVLTFLSPAYLESRSCVEQYNIALCCNRREGRHLLSPFYIETIPTMPTYMCLVQYVDCR